MPVTPKQILDAVNGLAAKLNKTNELQQAIVSLTNTLDQVRVDATKTHEALGIAETARDANATARDKVLADLQAMTVDRDAFRDAGAGVVDLDTSLSTPAQ